MSASSDKGKEMKINNTAVPMKLAYHSFIGSHGRIDFQIAGECCCDQKEQSPLAHAKKLAISQDFNMSELHCLARVTMAAGDAASIDFLAKRLLSIAPKVDGEGKRKERDDDEEQRKAKQRKLLEEAQELGQTLLLFNRLTQLRQAVPVATSTASRPSVAAFLGAVEAYLSAYVSFTTNRYVARHGCGLFVRRSTAEPLGNGVYQCDVFSPKVGDQPGQVVFEHYVASVDLDGKISGTPGPKDPGTMPIDQLFEIIGNAFVQGSDLEVIGIDASVTANGSRTYSIMPGGGTVPFEFDLDEMSLKRTMVALNFLDSFASTELATMTPAKTFQRLLERIVAEGITLPRGADEVAKVHELAREALKTFTSSVFKITVAGGARSSRTYTTRVDPTTRAFAVRIVGIAVPFEQFINDAFPSQLFVAPDLTVPVEGDDEIEKDFANKAYGRELSITLRTGEVFALENIVVVLNAVTTSNDAPPPPPTTTVQEVTPTNDSGALDVREAAHALASTGTAQLANGMSVDYPQWTSTNAASDVVALDNQVTGVANDADDDGSFEMLYEILTEEGQRAVRRAFVILENLRVMQEAEQLTSRRLADDLVRIFEQLNLADDAMNVVVRFEMDATSTALLWSNWKAKRDAIVDEIDNIRTSLRGREKDKSLARVTVTVKGGTMRTTAEFTSARIIDAEQFTTRFVDRKGVEAFVSASRDNGLAPFSTQFPFDPTAVVEQFVPSPAQPLPEPATPYELVLKRSAAFAVDGILYYTMRQFEEASRFAGFPELQASLCKPVFKDVKYEEDEELRLCSAVHVAEKAVAAAGATLLRQKFSTKEFEHAIISRVFQNYWLYKKALTLFRDQPNIELHLLPRIVLRYDPQIGENQMSLEHLTAPGFGPYSDLFNKAMKTLKRLVLAHASSVASQTIPSMLPSPGVLAATQKKRAKNSLRVSFIIGADTSSAHQIFVSLPVVVENDEVKKLYWRGDLMHMLDDDIASMSVLFTKSGVSETNAITSNKSLFGVHRNARRHGTVADLLAAEYKDQDDLFDVVSTLGSVTNQRGVPSLTVEVSAFHDDEDNDVVVFRSKQELALFFDDGERSTKMIILENQPDLASDPKNPSTVEAFLWRSGSDIWLEAYGIVSRQNITSLFGRGQAAVDMTLDQRVARQPLGLPRPVAALAEEAEQFENKQPTSSKTSGLVDLTLNDPDDDVDDKQQQQKKKLKPRRVILADVPKEDAVQIAQKIYIDEGRMALDEAVAPPVEQPPTVVGGGRGSSDDDDDEDSASKPVKPVPQKKKQGSEGRIAVKQTGETLVAQPTKVEISDHGFVLVSKRVGYKERSSEALVASQQALFLHPTHPNLIDAEGLNQSKFLDAIAQNFTSLMPRRSAKVLRKVSSQKLELIDAVNTAKGKIQKKAQGKIEALKEEVAQARREAVEKGISNERIAALVLKNKNEWERIQRDADVEMEKKEAELYEEYNAKMTAAGKKIKSPPKSGGGGKADDIDEEEDEQDLIDADLDEALAHTYEDERELNEAVESLGAFFVDGKKFSTLYEFCNNTPDLQDRLDKLVFAARARIMQNRALYMSVLALNKRVIQLSSQAILKLIPMVEKGLPESEDRKRYQEGLKTAFRLTTPFPATKPLSTLKQNNKSLVITARRIRLTGAPVPTNVMRAVALVESDEVKAFIGNREQFFDRTETLKWVNKLLSPVIEIVTATSTSDAKAAEKEEGDAGEGDGEKEKPTLKEIRLRDEAVEAAHHLFGLDMANVDIVVAINNGESVEGMLIGGFIDDPKGKTHTFEVATIEASTHQAASRLLNYAEHALKYLDVAQSNGRHDSRPIGVNVIDEGMRNLQVPANYVNASYAMQMRGYARIDLEMAQSAAWTLGVDSIVDRVNYLAADKFSSVHLDWMEDDIVTKEQWKNGTGRSYPLVIGGRLITVAETNDETDELETKPIRVWREAPHPFFVPEKPTVPLQEYFVEESSLEPNTYLVVKCYMLDDSGDSRKLLYASDPAPDWIKMNGRVALLPFSNWFGDFVANNPETYVMKDVRKVENQPPTFANAEEDLLLANLGALLTSVRERAVANKVPVPENTDPRLAGATDDELNSYKVLTDAIADLREGMRYIDNNDNRNQDARLVKFNPDTHIDWAPNKHLLENAVVDFVEPRSMNLHSHTIGTVDSLTKTWSNRVAWNPAFGGNLADPLNQPYTAQAFNDAVRERAPSWRQLMARTGEQERWRVFMNKYKPPQPYTHLSTMLVLAQSTVKTLQFEIEEQTFFASDVAAPRVIFRSMPLPIEKFFDQDLPSSGNLRVRKNADGSLVEKEAERVVGPEGEKLEEYEDDEDVFVRSLKLVNTLTPSDDIVDLNTSQKQSTGPGQEPRFVPFVAKVGRANTIKSFEIEINNNVEKSDLQPERAIIGAFFIETEPTPGALAKIEEADPNLITARKRTKQERAEAMKTEHMSLGLYGDDTDSDSEFDYDSSDETEDDDEGAEEEGEGDDGEASESMARLAKKFSFMK